MKKIFATTLIALALLAILALPLAISAQTGGPECCKLKRDINLGGTNLSCAENAIVGKTSGDTCQISGADAIVNCTQQSWGMFCLLNTLYNVIDWIFVVLVAIVGLFVIMGAFNYLTSAGDPEKTKNGRLYIMYAAIGLAVAFLAKAIPAIVRLIVGV